MFPRITHLVLLAAFGLTVACAEQPPEDDLWLEPSAGERALAWVSEHTEKTLAELGADPRFARYEAEAAAILTDPKRIPYATPMGDHVYDYWQDREHPYGVWRRSPTDAFLEGEPEWQTLIDLDALSESEGQPWFLAGTTCRLPRCLVSLSRRSMDAAEVRELDVSSGEFVDGGFTLPEFKSRVWWEDGDTLLVATDWGPDSLTDAGYPRSLRRWRRGAPLADAELVFEVEPGQPRVSAMLVGAAGPGSLVAVSPADFFVQEYWLIDSEGERERLPLPGRAVLHGSFGDALLFRLNEDWAPTPEGSGSFSSGALVAISKSALLDEGVIKDARVVYEPAPDEAVREVVSAGDALYIGLLRDYRSLVLRSTPKDDGFAVDPLELGESAFVTLRSPGPEPGSVLLSTEGPLEPPRLWLVGPEPGARRLIFEGPAQFDTTGLETKMLETVSRDGTAIRYTVMAREGVELDGDHPTLIYGYGGYDVAVTPRYEPLFGKLWLERGGVYVHAYLRGGGERGPAWHQGAMLRNRQQPYDDMIAVIDDLQRRGYASPARTGIMGRSNGGLMVAVTMEQAADKLGAVVVGGPLIDMLRYALLPPGASWTGEYGRPDDPEMHDFLAGYSPYQQLRRDVDYPVPLVITATWDDRVLPAHARRFAAKLEALGHDVYYFEDEQGGHYWELAGGPHPGDWRLRARARAVEFTYLAKQLGNDTSAQP